MKFYKYLFHIVTTVVVLGYGYFLVFDQREPIERAYPKSYIMNRTPAGSMEGVGFNPVTEYPMPYASKQAQPGSFGGMGNYGSMAVDFEKMGISPVDAHYDFLRNYQNELPEHEFLIFSFELINLILAEANMGVSPSRSKEIMKKNNVTLKSEFKSGMMPETKFACLMVSRLATELTEYGQLGNPRFNKQNILPTQRAIENLKELGLSSDIKCNNDSISIVEFFDRILPSAATDVDVNQVREALVQATTPEKEVAPGAIATAEPDAIPRVEKASEIDPDRTYENHTVFVEEIGLPVTITYSTGDSCSEEQRVNIFNNSIRNFMRAAHQHQEKAQSLQFHNIEDDCRYDLTVQIPSNYQAIRDSIMAQVKDESPSSEKAPTSPPGAR